jgi:hypothetical protein
VKPLTVAQVGQYRRHLIKLVTYLDAQPSLRYFPEMQESVRRTRATLERGSDSDWSFTTTPLWRIPLERGTTDSDFDDRCLLVGAEISAVGGSIAMHSVSFSIAKRDVSGNSASGPHDCGHKVDDGTYRVLRKVHFDTDYAKGGADRPRNHIQLGGAIPVDLSEFHYCGADKLDLPRIWIQPMDPVLLLEQLLAQFRSGRNAAVIGVGNWKNLVRTSEDIWLKPHFTEFAAICGRNRTASLFEEACRTPPK